MNDKTNPHGTGFDHAPDAPQNLAPSFQPADLHKAEAAAREALTNSKTQPVDLSTRIALEKAVSDLLAALDAQPKAGEVWQYRANSTSRGKEWIDCRDEQIARQMEALGFEIRCLYAAPPAALAVDGMAEVDFYGIGRATCEVRNGVVYVGVDCMRDLVVKATPQREAPPAPAVPGERFPVGGSQWGWEGEYNRGWNECRAAMLAEQPAAAVPEGYKVVLAEPTPEVAMAISDKMLRGFGAYDAWRAGVAAAERKGD